MNATKHFVLSFLGPLIVGAMFCGVVVLLWDWLDERGISPLLVIGFAGLIGAVSTRWFMRNCVPVKCPFCGGNSYEIPERGNRFMCRVCGKDH
jgi:hypothetical protein